MESKKAIVAVDDSAIILKMLEKLLGETYDFHAFAKGMRALKYLKEHVPDLIILDIDMPEIDGHEMLRMLKEKKELKLVPVIFLTSNHNREDVLKAAKGGAQDYILKPIQEDVLMEKIHTLLNDKKELSWDDV